MTEWYRSKPNYANKHNSSELSVETSGCEMSDSFNIFSENLSPIPAIVPRKLDFTHIDDDDGIRDASPAPVPISPPYKRVRALKLFDSPHTPKTLLEKCSTPSHHPPRSRLFPPKLSAPSGMSGSSHHLHPPSDDSALGSLPPDDPLDDSRTQRRPIANINPFTPDGQALNKKKRALSKTPTGWGDATPEQPAKRLRESNISRYNVEFVDLGVIGTGEFGRVTRSLNRLDGCVYAVKRSLRPVAGSAAERAALSEVHAHAALGKHAHVVRLDGCVYAVKRSLRPVAGSAVERAALSEVHAHAALGKHAHVVRYYSAWAEDDHMIIQNEYCDGGSLQQRLEAAPLPEPELRLLLQHVADGLDYIHSLGLVHMDVKPANIFICGREGAALDSDDGYDDDRIPTTHTYKIGDLGHVTCVSAPRVEEGDCRYLPKEVLQEDFTHLTKADIFAFGLTLFEAGGGGPLPKNGQQWHDIRDGKLPDLPRLSREFNQLLKKMVDPDPTQRPSASRLRKHPLVHARDNKSKAALRRELAAAKLKNELLERRLQEAARDNKSKAALRRELAAAKLKNELLERRLQEAARCIKSLTPNLVATESAKFRTRSGKRLQKPRIDVQLAEMLQSVTSPARPTRLSRQKRT